MDLVRRSVELILENQDPGGAFVACPSFPTYRYSWLRDGSFIAYAMLVAGEDNSTRRFLEWCDRAIRGEASRVERLESMVGRGERPEPAGFLPTRYTLEGEATGDDWPNFQTDGYGAWLWCLAQWLGRTGRGAIPGFFSESVALSVRYIRLSWRLPCYDCWEEFGDKVHLSTLAALYGGLAAIEPFAPGLGAGALAAEIRGFTLGTALPVGRFPKFVGSTAVDASLLWLGLPFGLVDLGDAAYRATAERIEASLLSEGGTWRYAGDTYYGGGRWLILSAWLGWLYAETGRVEEARRLLAWVESKADPSSGHMPEQVAEGLGDPAWLPVWVARWGKSASPLLWSHAMHVVLADAVARAEAGHALVYSGQAGEGPAPSNSVSSRRKR